MTLEASLLSPPPASAVQTPPSHFFPETKENLEPSQPPILVNRRSMPASPITLMDGGDPVPKEPLSFPERPARRSLEAVV